MMLCLKPFQVGRNCSLPPEAGTIRHADDGEPGASTLHHGDATHHRLDSRGSEAGPYPHFEETG